MLSRWLWISALLLLILTTSVVYAEELSTPKPKWQEAQSFYEQGKFEEALKLLQANPSESGSYYYNLGSVYLKNSKAGPAVAYLEKANRLSPHDPSIQQNLRIAKTQLAQTLGADHIDPASTQLEEVIDRISLDEIRGGLGLLGFILILFWFKSYLKLRSLRKTMVQPAGFLTLLSFIFMASLYAAQRIGENHPGAICLDQQVIRSGPGERYQELSQAEAGTKLRILGPAENSEAPPQELWRQIRYSQQRIGWVRADGLLVL